jgi:hypothetical protein
VDPDHGRAIAEQGEQLYDDGYEPRPHSGQDHGNRGSTNRHRRKVTFLTVRRVQEEDPKRSARSDHSCSGRIDAIKSFCRDDVKALCDSEERFKRIETWEEKIYLYGKVSLQRL